MLSPDKYLKNYIDGKLVPAASGKYFDNTNPATGKVYSKIPDSTSADVQKAYEAAERALCLFFRQNGLSYLSQ